MKKAAIYLILLLAAIGCTYEFPETEVLINSGTADFSTFVCIGDNYTSGFMDGALYTAGQVNSLGSLLARQLEDATGGVFYQADIDSENGYNPLLSGPTFTFGRMICSYPSLTAVEPVTIVLPGEIPVSYTGDRELLTDFSIPFMKSYQALQPEFASNIYFNRIAINPGTSTLLDQATASSPTFFLLWVGMYDALHFATSGAQGDYDPPSDPVLLNDNDLTPEDLFENSYRQLVTALLTNPQTKGVIVNLPSFDDLPFFYTYQYDFIRLTNGQKSAAQSHYFPFNQAVIYHNQIPDSEFRPMIDFNDNGPTLYPQPVVVEDDSLCDAIDQYGNPIPKIRQLNPDELILLTIPINLVTNGLGWTVPVPKEYYLNTFDIHVLNVAINRYNEIIQQVVEEFPDQLVLADLHTPIKELAATGRINSWGIPEDPNLILLDGVPLKADLSMNSIFSLDGLHFNQRGNAWVASQIIEAINLHFGSNISSPEVNQYVGNTVILGN